MPTFAFIYMDFGLLKRFHFGINAKEFKGSQYIGFIKRPLSSRPKIGFQAQLLLHVGQKYCKMLSLEHTAILSTFMTLPFIIQIFVLSIFEWPLKTDFYCSCISCA